MGAGSGRRRARIIHHGSDEQLIKQDSVPNEEITLPIQEGIQHTYILSSFLSELIDVRRPGESCMYGHPQITSCFDPLDWFLEECYWSRLNETPSTTLENYRRSLRDINGDFPFTQPQLKVVEV
jgi:hypothetical protein